jgi:hypothetical protein
MPFRLVQVDGGWKVQDDKGKSYSDKPMSRRAALGQERALSANMPEASKKKETIETVTLKHLGDQHDQSVHGKRYGLSGVQALAKKHGLAVGHRISLTDAAGNVMHAGGVTEARRMIRERAKIRRGFTTKDVVPPMATGINATGPGGLTGVMGLGGGKWIRMKKKVKETETPMKVVDGQRRPASDFLVVDDPQQVSSWHLPVKVNGKIDHLLMGAAWAALTDPNGHRGQKYTGPGKQAAIKKLRALYASEKMDIPGEASKKEWASLVVYKDKNTGQDRWIITSSNGFRDRDGEIVATKALNDDVARSDETGDYGPLRWWHLDDPPLDLGNCDFRMVHGHTLVESGTFKNHAIARTIKAAAPKLGVSLGFNHPEDEPDSHGVYNTISTFERSLLPSNRAANALTGVLKGETMVSKAQKIKEFRDLLEEEGLNPDEILGKIDATEKQAQNAGVAFKEKKKKQPPADEEGESPDEEAAETPEEEDAEDEQEKARHSKGKKPAPPADEEDDGDGEGDGEGDGDGKGDDDGEDSEDVIGNMSPSQFKEFMAKCMKEALQPIAEKMHSHNPDGSVRGAENKKKETSNETVLINQVAELTKTVGQLTTRLKELEEGAPGVPRAFGRGGAGYDPSQEDDNVLTPQMAQAIKEGKLGPHDASKPNPNSPEGGMATMLNWLGINQ